MIGKIIIDDAQATNQAIKNANLSFIRYRFLFTYSDFRKSKNCIQ